MDSKDKKYELISQSDYARRTKKSRQLVKYYVDNDLLDTELISGIKFVKIAKDGPLSTSPPESK